MRSKTQTEIDMLHLQLMYEKNPAIRQLIGKLDLIHVDKKTGEVTEPTDIELLFNQTNKNKNKMAKSKATKYSKEIESPRLEIVKFNEGEMVEFVGLKKGKIDFGKGDEEIFISKELESEDEIAFPTNVELSNKLKNLYRIVGGDSEDIEFAITLTGSTTDKGKTTKHWLVQSV